jgi:hypothetical protein
LSWGLLVQGMAIDAKTIQTTTERGTMLGQSIEIVSG